MKINDLITQIRQREPKALKNTPDRAAVRLVRAILSAIGASVDACEEGRVPVIGLGVFVVTKKIPSAGGETKRIIRFRSLKPRSRGKGKGKAA